MRYRLFALLVAAFVVLPVLAPRASSAASTGLSWDSVTKFEPGTDVASVKPGSFHSDYATASAVQVSTDSGGGMMAKMKAAMQAARGFAEAMRSGFAQKHYVAGTKDRTDDVSLQKATIRDCSARTITYLNLAKKTYRVESMDHPAQSSSGSSTHTNPSTPEDDGSRIALDITNTALGATDIDSVSTQGYRSLIKMTTTNKSGDAKTVDTNRVAYYSSYSEPNASCSVFGLPISQGMPGAGGSPMASGMDYARLMQTLEHASALSNRVSFKSSGPALPSGRMALFDAVGFSGTDAAKTSVTFVTERGNVHTLDAGDPIFSVPSDFTKEQ